MSEKFKSQDSFIKGIPVRHVRIFGQNDEPASCDPISNALIQIDATHARIHQGLFHSIGFTNLALGASASMNCLLKVKDKEVHMRPRAVAGADARFFVFEGVVVSVEGTENIAANRNRLSSHIPTLQIFNGSTITDDGVQLDEDLIVGGTNPAKSIGGESELTSEWVLAPNTDYLFRLTNITAQATPAHVHLDFYEIA